MGKSLTPNHVKRGSLIVLSGLVLIGYQNCSEQKFSTAPTVSSSLSDDGGTTTPPPGTPQYAIAPKFECRNVTTGQAYGKKVVVEAGQEIDCRAETFNDQLTGYNWDLTNNIKDSVKKLDASNGWTYLGSGKYFFGPQRLPVITSTYHYQTFVIDSNGREASLEITYKSAPGSSYSWRDAGTIGGRVQCGHQVLAIKFECINGSGVKVDDSLCPAPKPVDNRIVYNQPQDIWYNLIRPGDGRLINHFCSCATFPYIAGDFSYIDDVGRNCYKPFGGCDNGYRPVAGSPTCERE